MTKRNSILLLALVPVVFLFIVIIYVIYAGPNYPAGVDPEYNYLFNGITLAHLKFHLNAVGHPGTPIQCLIAVVARVVHFFRPGTLWDDVMLNPELYIKAPVHTANLLNAIALFLLGFYVFRYTKNIMASIVLQLSPFAFLMTVEVHCRLMPELIMVSIISAWIIIMVKILYENQTTINYKKYSVILALLFGFSLADKLTFLPFFFIPLCILPGWKLKVRFIILSVLAFFLFAFPAINNLPKFTGWVSDIFIHKGVYGSGDRGIVDIPYFTNNIRIIFKSTRQLWIALLILGIAYIAYLRTHKDVLARISIGIILTVGFHFVITAKHYAFYYLVPSLLLTVFVAFVLYLIMARYLPMLAKRKVPEALFVIAVLLMVINTTVRMNRQLTGLSERKKMHLEAIETFRPFLVSNNHKIVVASYYGCSAVEYSLLFGLLESGRYGKELTAEYKKHYPSTLIYLPWGDAFYDGVYQISPKDSLKPDVAYTLFVADHSQQTIAKIKNMLSDTTGYSTELNLLKEYLPKSEAIYQLKLTQ